MIQETMCRVIDLPGGHSPQGQRAEFLIPGSQDGPISEGDMLNRTRATSVESLTGWLDDEGFRRTGGNT